MRNLRLKAPASVVPDYFRLFVNRRAYTLQSNRPHPQSARHYYYRPKGKETAHRLSLTLDTIRRHLEGEITIGLYSINPATQYSKWVAIDADFENSLADLLKLRFYLRQDGVESALENSHRGGHLWIFMAEPLPARDCRIYVCGLILRLGIPVKGGKQREGTEIFPKHDALKPGRCGNAIRGPLGIRRGAAQRFWFDGADEDVGPQMSYLDSLPKMTREQLARLIAGKTIPPELAPPQPKPELNVTRHPGAFRILDHISTSLRTVEQEAKQANIIIRRHELRGACGDIGFARQPDGRLTLIADELDAYHGYGEKWLGRVLQLYKEKQTLAVARAGGYILKQREVIQTKEGQQVRLQFAVRR